MISSNSFSKKPVTTYFTLTSAYELSSLGEPSSFGSFCPDFLPKRSGLFGSSGSWIIFYPTLTLPYLPKIRIKKYKNLQ